MEYDRLPIALKRYTFQEKMKIAHHFSLQLMDYRGLKQAEKLIKLPMPWELETYATVAALTDREYDNKELSDKKYRKFYEMIKAIRDHIPQSLGAGVDDSLFSQHFTNMMGLNQFVLQEDGICKLYRYNFIFSFKNDKVDMLAEFKKRYGCPYSKFVNFAMIINVLLIASLEKQMSITKILDYLYRDFFKDVVSQLMIERTELKDYYTNRLEINVDDYPYCFKLWYQYLFIVEDGTLYFPLPHLLFIATTSSLLYRLTENNDELRRLIGKEILESYLLHLVKSKDIYDEVTAEITYKYKGQLKQTLDLMFSKDQKVVLMDSKSTAPSIGLRVGDDESFNKALDILSDSLKQAYIHVKDRFNKEYFLLSVAESVGERDIFGVIVCLDDTYIRRDFVYKEAAKKLGLESGTHEFDYLCSNIKLINLYELERIVFKKRNIIDLLCKNRDDKTKWFDFVLDTEDGYEINEENSIINVFTEEKHREIMKIIDHLVDLGLVEKAV